MGESPTPDLRAHRSLLFRKYLTVLVVLVAGTLMLSGLIEGYFSYLENQTALVGIQRAKATGAAARIEQFVTEIERQMRDRAQAPTAAVSLEQRRGDLLRLLRQAPSLTEVSYLDPAGREQMRVSRLAPNVSESSVDYSRDAKFLDAKSGKTYFSRVYFRGESEPYMTIGIADRGPNSGVTVAEVNLKFIWDVVLGIKIGDEGYAYVVDPHGQLVAHPDISLVLQKTDLSALPQVRSALEASRPAPGDFEEATIAPNFQGRQVLITHAEISPPGWIVLVEQPLEEVFAPLYASLLRSAVLLLVGLAVAILASLLLARRMVAPIRSLQAGAALVGAGALDHRIALKTGDELEVLADEFDRMAARLHESYSRLEQKVEERTRDLAVALNENVRLLQAVERQRQELTRFVSPQVAALLTSDEGQRLLDGHRRSITVLFCDLRGFSAFSETAEPEEVLAVLREYHAAMGELIVAHSGTLEHFAGDGMMVFFNDPVSIPGHERQAVQLAIAMRARFAELSQGWRRRGHELGFGIGAAVGHATLGRIGFEGRYDYGAVGNVVIVASRLCGAAKDGQILLTQRLHAAVEQHVNAEFVGELSLKGQTRPVPAFNVMALRARQ